MRGVVGNVQAQTVLERALATEQMRHAYLLHGPAGVGKRTLALAFAQAALCLRRQPGESAACGECASCRKLLHGNHPDLAIIEPADDKRWLSVDAVREMQHLASLAPTESAHRIFIIPNVDNDLREATANTLLKTLEEPPEGVIILLLAVEPDALLPTILSRCQLITLRPLMAEEISQALRERGVAPDAAAQLAGLANGRLGWAIRAHERPDEQAEREHLLERLIALVAASTDERMRSVATLGADNAATRVTLDQWITWWRDVTLAANGAHALLSTGAARREAERVGVAIGPERARAFLDALLAALASLDINANPRLTLENLALALPAVRQVGARR